MKLPLRTYQAEAIDSLYGYFERIYSAPRCPQSGATVAPALHT
jgi:hypothetical protein